MVRLEKQAFAADQHIGNVDVPGDLTAVSVEPASKVRRMQLPVKRKKRILEKLSAIARPLTYSQFSSTTARRPQGAGAGTPVSPPVVSRGPSGTRVPNFGKVLKVPA